MQTQFKEEIPYLLSYLSKLTPAITEWAEVYMNSIFAAEIMSLINVKSGFHYTAAKVSPDQILDFSVDNMTAIMEDKAPNLWRTLSFIMEADPRHRRIRQNMRDRLNISENYEPDSDSEDSEEEDIDVVIPFDQSAKHNYLEDLDSTNSQTKERTHHEPSKKQCKHIIQFDALSKIKKSLILSIIMNNNSRKCNAYQTVNSLTWHATNTPTLTIQILAHVGLAVSPSSINKMVTSLTSKQQTTIRQWASDYLFAIAYDNFDVLLPSPEPTVENPGMFWSATSGTFLRLHHVKPSDMQCSDYLWARSPLNRHRREQDRPPAVEWTDLRQEPEVLQPRQPSRMVRLIAWHLRHALITSPEFKGKGYDKHLGEPEVRKKIPVKKTQQLPVKAMDIKQSKTEAQSEICTEMLSAAGIGEPRPEGEKYTPKDISDYVVLVHGDLGTFERVIGAELQRSIEKTPFRRLQYVIFVPGLFHVRMACADAIWRALILPVDARKGPYALFRHLSIIRPKETGKFTSIKGPNFRAMNDLIVQDSKACFRDCWRIEAGSRNPNNKSLLDFAKSNPSWDAILKMSLSLASKHFVVEPHFTTELKRPAEERDMEFENTQMKYSLYFLYLEIGHACNSGDIGRVEDTLFYWISIFQAVGKHKYATLLTRFLLDLRFLYPEGLREAIRMNWLCNPLGREGTFRAIDWLVEINNCATKVTFSGSSSNKTKEQILKQSNLIEIFTTARKNVASDYRLVNLTSRHARPDMTATHLELAHHLEDIESNEKKIGRNTVYHIPNLFAVGMSALHKTQSLGKNFLPEDDTDSNEPTLETRDLEAI